MPGSGQSLIFRLVRWSAVAVAAIAVALGLWYIVIRVPPIPRRPLRIGFEPNPPVQILTDAGYTGLAVESVNEAAKRAGVTLQWVATGTSSDEAFAKGLVDLWPLMADLPERRKYVHFSKPWLHSNHVLLFRGDVSPEREFTDRIALTRLPIHLRLLRQGYPKAQPVQLPTAIEAIQEVCRGAVPAVFLESRVALKALQDRPLQCSPMDLRVRVIPDLTIQLAVASTFEVAAAADAIRRQIGGMYRDGTLASLVTKYSFLGLEDTWPTYELLESAERAKWIAWGVGALGLVLLLAFGEVMYLRQRKRSEAALRDSEERFRAFFQQAAVGVSQCNLEGEVMMVNDRYCAALGYTREELVGKRLVDKTHPDDIPQVLANRSRLLTGETSSYSMEMRYFRKDGSMAWVDLYGSVVREGDGRPKYLITVAEDITERKQAQAALRESEERFRNLADTAPVMIWTSGPDKLCTFVNKGWLILTGRTMEQELGSGWAEGMHPDDREGCLATYSSSFDARRSFRMEYRLRRADGQYRWLLDEGVPRVAPDGSFAGYIGCAIDITEVKRAQDETLSRQKAESLGILTAGIAHDFNNLLGSILADAELLETNLAEGSPPDEGIQRIKAVGFRASEIVRELMIYAGQDQSNLEPLDVSQLVEEMIELLRVSISKHAALQMDLPRHLPAVRGNAPQCRQVLMNLVINASEAIGEKDGIIRVATSCITKAQNSVFGGPADLPAGDYLQLEVSDTGCGMSEETKAQIFDPFFTTKFAGRGLGLAVVQGIVRAHGGAIYVASAPGQGTTFQILLPTSGPPSEPDHRGTAEVRPERIPKGTETVLLVEDESPLRQAVSIMLRRKGFLVIEAADGSAAVELIRGYKSNIDLLLLDVTIPGASSREVITEVRRVRPNTKVLLTSAYSREMAMHSIDQQVAGFIRKPFRFADLVQLLQHTLSS